MDKSWGQIATFYNDLQGRNAGTPFSIVLQDIEQLARFVAASSLDPVLFGWTSMWDLCIQQTDSYPGSAPFLRISPRNADLIELRYVDTQFDNRQWHREVASDQVIAALIDFLKQLRWVSGPVISSAIRNHETTSLNRE